MIFLAALLVIFVSALYFLPTIVASCRSHPNQMPIFIINLFLGWTLLVWVISLAWACVRISDEDMAEIIRKHHEKIEKLQATYLARKPTLEA